MRKLISALAVAFALLLPGAASAWPTNLESYGLNTGIQSGGNNSIEQFNATLYDYSIRPAIDRNVTGGNSLAAINAVYGSGLDGLAHNGIGVLPIMDWADPSEADNKRKIDTSGERSDWRTFVKNATLAVNAAYANNGVAKPGAVEIWNEPNCDAAYPLLDDYWTNVYTPAYNGVRDASSDTNVVVGGLGMGSGAGCNSGENWISTIISRGYSNIVNAYAVHAYGYKYCGSDSSCGFEGLSIAHELKDACQVSNRKLLLTETGVESDANSGGENNQQLETQVARNAPDGGGYPVTRLRSNWPGVSGLNTSGRDTLGIWGPGPSYTPKAAEADWRSWASFHGRVGALDNTGPGPCG